MIKTSKQEIAHYWQAIYPEMDLNATQCWRCGIKKRLDRCHIQAASIEGADQAQNFVLLCKHCHIDSPNIENPEFIWYWLKFFHHREHADLWYERGVREYEILFNENLEAQIGENQNEFALLFESELKKATRHFGQPSLNPASVAGVIYESIKLLKQSIAL